MVSSGGGGDDSGAGMMALMGQGRPMPGLPVAGSPEANVDPYNYGQFQSFLPEIQAEGQNPMATGLRPDMFKYRSPNGEVVGGGGGAGGDDLAGQIKGLRDELAKLQSGSGGGASDNSGFMGGGSGNGGFPQYGDPNAAAKFMGGQGVPGSMGMGGIPSPGAYGGHVYGAGDRPGTYLRDGALLSAGAGGPQWTPDQAKATMALLPKAMGGSDLSGANVGAPGDPRIAAAIAANMAAQGGPQKTNFGVPGAATTPEWQPGMAVPNPYGS